MATFIHTGSEKCKVQHLMECPVCGDEFDTGYGVFVDSVTLNDKLLVCKKHSNINVNNEVAIQDALKNAIINKNGYVMVNGKLVKKWTGFREDKDTKALKL